MAYLTAADFREGTSLWPDIELAVAQASDARLGTEITEQSAFFDRLTRDHFEPATDVELSFYGSGTSLLLTPGYRLTAVESVTEVYTDGSSEVLLASQYILRPYGLERVDRQVWAREYRYDFLNTDYGWAATPYKVKRAVALLVYESIRGSKGRHHATRWSTPDVEYEVDPNSSTGLPEVDRIVAQYRVPFRVL